MRCFVALTVPIFNKTRVAGAPFAANVASEPIPAIVGWSTTTIIDTVTGSIVEANTNFRLAVPLTVVVCVAGTARLLNPTTVTPLVGERVTRPIVTSHSPNKIIATLSAAGKIIH